MLEALKHVNFKCEAFDVLRSGVGGVQGLDRGKVRIAHSFPHGAEAAANETRRNEGIIDGVRNSVRVGSEEVTYGRRFAT